MKININESRKLFELQQEFNTCFPYLKIEFFHSPHGSEEGSPKRLIRNPGRSIKECTDRSGEMIITADMSVGELEQKFREQFGLFAQVFRHSGKVWLETTLTDSWTLAEQNSQGQELSNSKINLSRGQE
jgi:hypothetical protein